jgi:hypothetical protein
MPALGRLGGKAQRLRRETLLKPIQASSYTFRSIIEGSYLYIDKTQYLYELVRGAIGIYFLARPRCFGKSLTIPALEEIFRGNKELFRGLWIHESDYAWRQYPVIRIDFSRLQAKSTADLQSRIVRHLYRIAREHGITLEDGPFDVLWDDLIVQLSAGKQVVVLIDEYDKPILDNIDNLPEAIQIRETLKQFYIFKLVGLRIDAEVCTNQGRIDCVVETSKRIYLFEFKLNQSTVQALDQMMKTEYYQRYRLKGKPLRLIGANFDSKQRTISECKIEPLIPYSALCTTTQPLPISATPRC